MCTLYKKNHDFPRQISRQAVDYSVSKHVYLDNEKI